LYHAHRWLSTGKIVGQLQPPRPRKITALEVAKVHKERLERAGNISAQEKKKALKRPEAGESNYYRVEQINLDVLKCVFDTFVRITADDPEVLVVDPFMGSGTTGLAARMVTTTHYQLLLLLRGFNSTCCF
jgi:hypothetical protein